MPNGWIKIIIRVAIWLQLIKNISTIFLIMIFFFFLKFVHCIASTKRTGLVDYESQVSPILYVAPSM